ncbi:response regulator [Cereibacter changlensis]|uniref:Response regulator n=1 Tax=Cereibacter changlensis TaxID=402884 RepID=A0A4U0YV76_9RHOB|nr:response regulator [Cereibacter changlensis]TKA94669.1 response regulator [Cereibacter changlensis]
MGILRILAVDDDPVFLMLLQHVLGRLGYDDVEVAGTAAAALEHLQGEEGFDCLLLDFDIPGVDGIQLCRRIRQMQGYADVPILMMSNAHAASVIEAAFAAGATDYFTKPLDDLELRARMGMTARLVEERRRRAMLADRVHAQLGLPDEPIRFVDPIPLREVPDVVEYEALENYLLALGRSKLHGHAAIAFRIGNAEEIFAATDAICYADVLAHVASIIADQLKDHEFLMAHAGRGEFVCITARHLPVQAHVLAQEIAARLADRARIYAQLGVPRPVLQVGDPMTTGLFSRTAPSDLLGRARRALRNAAARQIRGEVVV